MGKDGSKLVFVGGVGAGKSSAIRAISDTDPVCTDMPLSGGTNGEKSRTTVALDYSSIDLDGELLHLYGVPGQKYMNFMWPMVCAGAIGIVVLVNACQDNAIESTIELLKDFGELAPDASFVVGVTKSELARDFQFTAFRDRLVAAGYYLPVVRLDARVASQVEFMLNILLAYHHAGVPL